MSGRIINKEKGKRLPLPALGHIACGEKILSRNGKEIPHSLDYFKASGDYAKYFHEVYGEKPTRIQVVFPSDDADLVCNEYYELRDSQGKKVATGDGETFKVWSDKIKDYKTLTTEQYPNIMDMVQKQYGGEWKITLKLTFLLPKVRGIMVLWTLTTKGSASSIPQVRDTFDSMLEQNGKVAGVIFDLIVKMHTSDKPGASSKYPVISLVPNEGEENVRMVTESRKPIMIEQ